MWTRGGLREAHTLDDTPQHSPGPGTHTQKTGCHLKTDRERLVCKTRPGTKKAGEAQNNERRKDEMDKDCPRPLRQLWAPCHAGEAHTIQE